MKECRGCFYPIIRMLHIAECWERLLHAKLYTLKWLYPCEQLTLSTYPFFSSTVWSFFFGNINAILIRQHINMSHWDFHVFTLKLRLCSVFGNMQDKNWRKYKQTNYKIKHLSLTFADFCILSSRLATILYRNQNLSSFSLNFCNVLVIFFFGVLSLT